MQQFIEEFEKTMAIKNFSNSTQKSYGYYLKKYLEHCREEKRDMNSLTFRDYLYDLIKNRNLSVAALKQSIGAVKFFLSTSLTSHTI
jgi:site-specific recombinase XerD